MVVHENPIGLGKLKEMEFAPMVASGEPRANQIKNISFRLSLKTIFLHIFEVLRKEAPRQERSRELIDQIAVSVVGGTNGGAIAHKGFVKEGFLQVI